MRSGKSEATRKWIAHVRFALVPAIVGGLIVAFVAVTGGEYGAWLLWIAVPLLMISLGYFYLVSALPVLLGKEIHNQSETELAKKPHEK